MSTLANRVKGSVRFVYFRDMFLWYVTDDGFEFPVPVADTVNTQGASPAFLATDKAITFMRWIRKHMEVIASAKATTPTDA